MLIGMLLIASASIATAQEPQSHDSITTAIKLLISEQLADKDWKDLDITIGKLDPRLRLNLCQGPLEAFFNTPGRTIGNISMGVRCPEATGWIIYIPVSIKYFSEVVVAMRPLPRNTLLQASDIGKERHDISLTNGYHTNSDQVIGQVTRHPLKFGAVITPKDIEFPVIIHKGDEVAIRVVSDTITVEARGEALSDGHRGDSIKIRNSSSHRVVEGLVTMPGIVEIRM